MASDGVAFNAFFSFLWMAGETAAFTERGASQVSSGRLAPDCYRVLLPCHHIDHPCPRLRDGCPARQQLRVKPRENVDHPRPDPQRDVGARKRGLACQFHAVADHASPILQRSAAEHWVVRSDSV